MDEFLEVLVCFFFFNDPAPTEIYPLSLRDALPICPRGRAGRRRPPPPSGSSRASSARRCAPPRGRRRTAAPRDRKSTRLNSSHANISYAVFCLKKKRQQLANQLL